jgi:hypothetical protein
MSETSQGRKPETTLAGKVGRFAMVILVDFLVILAAALLLLRGHRELGIGLSALLFVGNVLFFLYEGRRSSAPSERPRIGEIGAYVLGSAFLVSGLLGLLSQGGKANWSFAAVGGPLVTLGLSGLFLKIAWSITRARTRAQK